MYSIRWRFAVIYLLLAGIVLGLVAIFVSNLVEDYFVNQRINSQITSVNKISVLVAPYLESSDANSIYQSLNANGKEIDGRLLVLNNSGIVQADSFSSMNGLFLNYREIGDVLQGQKSLSYGFHEITNEETGDDFWVIYYTSGIRAEGKNIGALVFSTSIQDVVDTLNKQKMQILWIYLMACVAIVIVSLFATNTVINPVKNLRETATKISQGDLNQRVEVRGKSEIAELGQTFNMMCDRIQDVDEQRSEFVSNASHELKTPLASMKILVESLLFQQNVDPEIYKEFLNDVNGEIDRMSNLINDLLLLSKMDSDIVTMQFEKNSLSAIISESINSLRPILSKSNIQISFYSPADIEADCDKLKIRQAVGNLIENAIKYSKSDGYVKIYLTKAGEDACITVEDNGVGIPPEHLNHIFERFYRVDKARSRDTGGTGLGLHIVRKIAIMHGGRVEVESTEKVGTKFMLYLPITGRARNIGPQDNVQT
jgi:heavy metal sensor kinase